MSTSAYLSPADKRNLYLLFGSRVSSGITSETGLEKPLYCNEERRRVLLSSLIESNAFVIVSEILFGFMWSLMFK